VLQQAVQPLEDAHFRFQAPDVEGDYRLRASLLGPNDRVAAVGPTVVVAVAPPPLPTPIPTIVTVFSPTQAPVVTAPAPGDEARLATRAPIRIGGTAVPKSVDYNATVTYAEGPLRSEPNFQTSKIVTDLRIGDRLLVIGATPDGGWYRAIHAATGVEGWVRNELVSLEVPLGDILREATALPPPATTPTP
jgi:hypothetical protein